MLTPSNKSDVKPVIDRITILQEVSDKQSEKTYVSLNRKCEFCGNIHLVPTGTCFVCQVCGTSMGCS